MSRSCRRARFRAALIWARVNRATPRLVNVLPNGPDDFPTVLAFTAGGVPEVMLHLRRLGLLHEDCLTVTGHTVGENLDLWERSERRQQLRDQMRDRDGIDPDDVILPPERARARGLTSTVCFPTGNLAPQGSVIKSTAIDAAVVGPDGIYRKTGPARVFTTERAAIDAIKGTGERSVQAGDVLVLICRGPLGAGMEEIYQITSALKYIPWGKQVAVITDARFSGVSTGACIGHVGPAPGSRSSGRHAVMGRVAERQRRNVGRLRVRHGRRARGPEGSRIMGWTPPGHGAGRTE